VAGSSGHGQKRIGSYFFIASELLENFKELYGRKIQKGIFNAPTNDVFVNERFSLPVIPDRGIVLASAELWPLTSSSSTSRSSRRHSYFLIGRHDFRQLVQQLHPTSAPS
jgi:hypothetical protein